MFSSKFLSHSLCEESGLCPGYHYPWESNKATTIAHMLEIMLSSSPHYDLALGPFLLLIARPWLSLMDNTLFVVVFYFFDLDGSMMTMFYVNIAYLLFFLIILLYLYPKNRDIFNFHTSSKWWEMKILGF